ncbi:MAG: hypothetical protein ABJD68_02500 [Nakamurella sp.]
MDASDANEPYFTAATWTALRDAVDPPPAGVADRVGDTVGQYDRGHGGTNVSAGGRDDADDSGPP